jgi:arsenate reductase-like glutaredoxin family protein
MLDHPTLIKRPVIINKNVVIIGFHPDEYQSQLT